MASKHHYTAGHCTLPPGFVSLRSILDGNVAEGSRVNVAGVVSDFRAPIPTRRQDWKCQIQIYDHSIEDDTSEAVLLDIFRSQNEMPEAHCGDVLIGFGVKVQRFRSALSLCTHWLTDIFIYESDKIPKPRNDASRALRPASRSQINRRPNKIENEFVSGFYASVDKHKLPSAHEFETRTTSSINVKKQKFSELKDVKDGTFVDTVAQIVREPYDVGGRYTLWVSDYTENPQFYNYRFMGDVSMESEYSDPRQKSGWLGPLGKRSIQITCYEPHAGVIRDESLGVGAWVSLRNMQIKFGRSGTNLEGFLREDQGAHGVKINISVETIDDRETTRSEVLDAIRRKRDYEKLRKEQLTLLTDAAKAGAKRRTELGGDADQGTRKKKKSKSRAERRVGLQLAYQQRQEQANGAPPSAEATSSGGPADLSTYIRCEHHKKPATSIVDATRRHEFEIAFNGKATRLSLPFINANYRTYARVIDFEPPKLEDFARSKWVSAEYRVLSDDGESDPAEPMSDSDHDDDRPGKYIQTWEWRFYLHLEDASSPREQEAPAEKKTVWVVVNNNSAQMLLSLNASDLHRDETNLGHLRQKLFELWGDLEERKAELQERTLASRPFDNTRPPVHSDDERDDDGAIVQRPQKALRDMISNRPFECCIRQYGVEVDEHDKDQADAGDGKRWQRMFGMFGTKIAT